MQEVCELYRRKRFQYQKCQVKILQNGQEISNLYVRIEQSLHLLKQQDEAPDFRLSHFFKQAAKLPAVGKSHASEHVFPAFLLPYNQPL